MIIFLQEFVLQIFLWILKAVDGIMELFSSLTGISAINYKGQEINLIEFLVGDSTISKVFWCIESFEFVHQAYPCVCHIFPVKARPKSLLSYKSVSYIHPTKSLIYPRPRRLQRFSICSLPYTNDTNAGNGKFRYGQPLNLPIIIIFHSMLLSAENFPKRIYHQKIIQFDQKTGGTPLSDQLLFL